MRRFSIFFVSLVLVTLACGEQAPAASFPTLETSAFNLEATTYGFFPSPPEISLDSVMNHYQEMGKHADFVLMQHAIPWQDFVNSVEGESQARTDILNQMILARQNDLEAIYVVDPLNGMNRQEFMGLPTDWEASFANPDIRAAFTNYTLWLVREFRPKYLGLASEINTYLDGHPDDAAEYVSLYHSVYNLVKAEAPETQIFVTFQWEDLNNMIGFAAEGRAAYDTNWDQIEVFEPNLDLWVISSYPFVAFTTGAEIPADYYTPLLTRTSKPLAVAEGGFTSRVNPPFPGDPQSQIDYLYAINDQIGGQRLAFWVYLLLNDFNLDSYSKMFREQGLGDQDLETLGLFESVGLREYDGRSKPALEIWDGFQNAR
ncbi:MAG: hypothetical protein QGD96_13360 [Anaerolineae bacterium]|nr:hypothetical protein [Anaerolineae bacterium]